jgi:hypothetical protein
MPQPAASPFPEPPAPFPQAAPPQQPQPQAQPAQPAPPGADPFEQFRKNRG